MSEETKHLCYAGRFDKCLDMSCDSTTMNVFYHPTRSPQFALIAECAGCWRVWEVSPELIKAQSKSVKALFELLKPDDKPKFIR